MSQPKEAPAFRRGEHVTLLLIVLASLIATVFLATAMARPPAGPSPDPKIAAWFASLRRDSDNFPCCDASDCREIEAEDIKQKGGSYIVTARREDYVMNYADAQDWKEHFGDVDKTDMIVPKGNITIRTDNPTGHAVFCYSVRINQVFCFVPYDFME